MKRALALIAILLSAGTACSRAAMPDAGAAGAAQANAVCVKYQHAARKLVRPASQADLEGFIRANARLIRAERQEVGKVADLAAQPAHGVFLSRLDAVANILETKAPELAKNPKALASSPELAKANADLAAAARADGLDQCSPGDSAHRPTKTARTSKS